MRSRTLLIHANRPSTLPTPSFQSPASPSTRDADALILPVRELQRQGGTWLPLRGKFLALMCSSEETEEARLFRRAATGLGARVAWTQPSLSITSTPDLITATTRVLAKLYDGIECQGMDAGLVRRLRFGCDVPVFDTLVATRPMSAALLKALEETAPPEDRSRLILQARLLNALT